MPKPREDVQRGALFHSTPESPIDRGTITQAILVKNQKVKSNGYWTSLLKKSEVQYPLDFTFFTVGLHFKFLKKKHWTSPPKVYYEI